MPAALVLRAMRGDPLGDDARLLLVQGELLGAALEVLLLPRAEVGAEAPIGLPRQRRAPVRRRSRRRTSRGHRAVARKQRVGVGAGCTIARCVGSRGTSRASLRAAVAIGVAPAVP